MYAFCISTLVDITNNGNLKKSFPFKTNSGDLVHDSHSLAIAKNQNSNFNTLVQLLQVRGNISWDILPERMDKIVNNTMFGSHYTGEARIWSFMWETEQADVYKQDDNAVGQLINDFDNVPIVNFCKETITFPSSAFITKDPQFKNTLFSYMGEQTK
jgi:hypothetical protein